MALTISAEKNKAVKTLIDDVGGYYTSTEAEGALQEVGEDFGTVNANKADKYYPTIIGATTIESTDQYHALKIKSTHASAIPMLQMRDGDETGFDINYDKSTATFGINKTVGGAYDSSIVSLHSDWFIYKGNNVWHAGNDGHSSTLDADLLDGQHGAYYAPIASPTFTGFPTAPTMTIGDNSTALSTTAFVQNTVAALVDASPTTLDTLNELAAALGDDPNFATTVTTAIGLKAPIAGPTFTGTLTAPTINASTALQIGGVAVTSSAAELNLIDTSAAGTIVNSKAVIYGAAGQVNATTLQIAGTSITSTAAELNILDGVTATAAELNLVDTSVAGTIVNNKAVIYGAAGQVNATTLQIAGVSITSTAAELNYTDGVTSNIQTQLDTKASRTPFTGTLVAATWSGASAPYSYALTVVGIIATDIPFIDVTMSGTYATDLARAESWSGVYRAVTSTDTITFYASSKPVVDLPFQVLVVR